MATAQSAMRNQRPGEQQVARGRNVVAGFVPEVWKRKQRQMRDQDSDECCAKNEQPVRWVKWTKQRCRSRAARSRRLHQPQARTHVDVEVRQSELRISGPGRVPCADQA